MLAKIRRASGAFVVDSFFKGLSGAGRLVPSARPERHGVERITNIAYKETNQEHHRLDVWRPSDLKGPLPVVLYIHGGGFRILSKETHWLMALAFARRGYVVFNINYRLSPVNPFPAAIEDACEAYSWIVRNAERWGGDANQLIVAGESAGANLAVGVAIAACFERPELWAKAVFDTGVVPRCVLPACGMHQVSEPERYVATGKMPRVIADRIEEVSHSYLPKHLSRSDGSTGMADPVVILEGPSAPLRPFPPTFSIAGTADPILDDTRRLHKALTARGVRSEMRIYPGEMHAFHALVWRPNARSAWAETFRFLHEVGLTPPRHHAP